MGMTIGGVLEWAARNYPEKTGLVYRRKNQEWTFEQLHEHVNRFASTLWSRGVRQGDVVSAFLYNTSEFVVTLFAAAKIGAIFNPINYRLTAYELQYILNDANSQVLVYEAALADVVKQARELGTQVAHHVYVDEPVPGEDESFYKWVAQGENRNPSVAVREDDLYIMMYTSGTTGRPKGVLHTHRDMVHHNFLMMQCMGLTKNDTGLSAAPLNHTAELHTSFLPRLHVGATNVLLHSFQAEEVLATIEKEQVTHMFAAPTMVNMMLHHSAFGQYDLSSLRLLGYGGASMAPILIQQFQQKVGADLVQMYGTTEMGPVMTVLHADEQLSRAGSAGKAILTHEVKIVRLTEDGRPSHPNDECGPGEVGEIIVKGPCMMREYYNRPEATENALAYGWYHTGDMASYDEDGYIWIHDRLNHMIVSGAENIYPREVEDQLVEHPDVLEAAVIGMPDPTWGQIVTAYIVAKPNGAATAEDLDAFLLQGGRLAKYKRPRAYHFVEALPKTPSGKIQKFVLEKQAKEVQER
ncbi:long-chain-fatty-acid--CoA ligase [Aneurinibacillus sp. BA2021]|nr:long-chain-fatty-acid--CoA ligase [Aneurinibacillus sp. BA2021]